MYFFFSPLLSGKHSFSAPTRKFVHVLAFSHQRRFNNYPGVYLLTAYANDFRFLKRIPVSEIMNEFKCESCCGKQELRGQQTMPTGQILFLSVEPKIATLAFYRKTSCQLLI